MKFAILAFIFLVIFLTFYLTITLWVKSKRDKPKKDEDKTPTEPILTAQPSEKKE